MTPKNNQGGSLTFEAALERIWGTKNPATIAELRERDLPRRPEGLPKLRDLVSSATNTRLLEAPVRDLVFDAESQTWAVLLHPDWQLTGVFRNILAFGVDGNPRWQVQFKGSSVNDCYMQLRVRGKKLLAGTFGGSIAVIDWSTGRVIEETLTK